MARAKDRELVSAVVLNYVRNGLPIAQACLAAGVAHSTFRSWKQSNQSLSIALKKAESEFELKHIQNITVHASESWQASAWILERKFPERYAKRVINVEPKQADSSGVLVKVPEPKLIETTIKADDDGV